MHQRTLDQLKEGVKFIQNPQTDYTDIPTPKNSIQSILKDIEDGKHVLNDPSKENLFDKYFPNQIEDLKLVLETIRKGVNPEYSLFRGIIIDVMPVYMDLLRVIDQQYASLKDY